MDPGSQLCSRARFWTSLRLDGELSEIERALLDAHLAGCAPCRAFAESAAAAVHSLRAAPLEVPAPMHVELPRTSRGPLALVAAVALVAAAVVAGGLLKGAVSTGGTAASAPRATAMVATVETPDQLRRLRRTSLLDMRQVPRELAQKG
jgi:predicted anti-sigma-YlaC factor YlaD